MIPNKCQSCGAESQVQDIQNTWTCDYCGSTNFQKELIEKSIIEKSNNDESSHLNYAIHSYENNNFDESLIHLNKLLFDDPSNQKGHIMKCILLSKTLKESNYQKSIELISSSISFAEKIDEKNDFFVIGKQDTYNNIADFYLCRIQDLHDEIKKTLYAYSSTNVNKAHFKLIGILDKLGDYSTSFLLMDKLVNNIKVKIKIYNSLQIIIIKYNKLIGGKVDFSGVQEELTSKINLLKKEYTELYNDIVKSEAGQFTESKKESGGCFIATATMGDYSHPTVLRLRFFRDAYLLNRNWGRIFTKFYYKWGPYPANFIEKSNVLKKLSYYTIVKPLSFVASKFIENK